ncbi:MAG: hypothetical protein BRD35_08025 [Bacteroidetes bacterium QH_7_62_13]|nr:MAG: hypothetical protein BRD35_08025 [Bacteroidetes bacterium QH_7_62_13]
MVNCDCLLPVLLNWRTQAGGARLLVMVVVMAVLTGGGTAVAQSAFNDVGAGLDSLNENASVAWGDFDNDGELDLVMAGDDGSNGANTTISENNGDGEDELVQAGYSDDGSFTNRRDVALYDLRSFTLTGIGPSPDARDVSVTADPASSVSDSSATLNGTVNPGGEPVRVYFALENRATGDTSVYAADTLTTDLTLDQPVSERAPDSLLPGTEYRYRVVAASLIDSVRSTAEPFATTPSAPVARTDSVSGVIDTSATLYGTVNPAGGTTDVQFPYYPTDRPSMADTASALETPVDSTVDRVVSAEVEGLTSGTSYTFATRAGNDVDTVEASARTFSTRTVRLSVLEDIVRAGAAQVGQGRRTPTLDIKNEGEAVLSDVQVSLEGADADDYRIVDDGDGPLDPGETRTVAVSFEPSATGNRAAILTATAAEGGADTTRLVGRGVRVTVEPGEVTRGEPATLTTTLDGGFQARSERAMYVRKGGTVGYQAIPVEGTDSSETSLQLTATVPDSLVTTRGIDYYTILASGPDTLTTPAGGPKAARSAPAHIPVSFDSLTAPVSLGPQSYRMVTVSAVPEGGGKAALERSYGDYDPAEWRVLRWRPSAGESGGNVEFPSLDSLRAGQGFWLITAAGDDLELGSGRTVKGGQARRVPLERGWNQVGSPFGYTVSWDTVRAASGLDPTAIDGPVVYTGGQYQYGQDLLRPWEGAFVRVPERDTLIIPPVSSGSGGGEETEEAQARTERRPVALRGSNLTDMPSTATRTGRSTPPQADGTPEGTPIDRSVPETGALPTDESTTAAAKTDSTKQTSSSKKKQYTLRLRANPENGKPHQVWMGLREEAEVGRDGLDFAQAPPIGATVRLSVVENLSGRTVPHAGSFKPPSRDGRVWELVLSNQSGEVQEARLELDSEGGLPSGQESYLLDLGREQRVAPGRVLELGAGERRRLKIVVGTEAFARSESEGIELNSFENELRANYPNPFGKATTLSYTLSEEREVTIEIYDVLGRRVRTLVQEEKQGPGLHEVRWRGKTQHRTPAGSGVYFYRIEAGDFTATKKMVRVR